MTAFARTFLRLESLEDRLNPAVTGNPWVDPTHLTLSFALDGSDIAGSGSSLQDPMNQAASTQTWKQAILKAFETWAYQANINIAVVRDDGSAFGSAGPAQGSPTHGDLRIGARPLDSSQVAIGTPFDLFDSWSGEVIFNSNDSFSVGSGQGYDLYSIALHEAGHALGIDDNLDPTSAMYYQYHGVRTGLSVGDIASIQSLYGPRVADPYEGSNSPTTINLVNSLSDIHLTDGTIGVRTRVIAGDINSNADVDWFQFNAPLLQPNFEVTLHTTGISSLRARLSVYDSWGNLVNSVVATDPMHGDLVVQIPWAFPLSRYHVKVEAGSADVFGAGAYRLAVGTTGSNILNQLPLPYLRALDQIGYAVNSLTVNLGLLGTPADGTWDATYHSGLVTSSDVDTYRFHTAATPNGTLLVYISATGSNTFDPWVEVVDANGNAVVAEVLSRQTGTVAVQVRNASPDADYYVRVRSFRPNNSSDYGDYVLAIDSRVNPVQLTEYADPLLTADAPAAYYTFTTSQDELHYFVLGATLSDPNRNVELTLTIRDDDGDLIRTLVWNAHDPISFNQFLTAGRYHFAFSMRSLDGLTLPTVTFRWKGIVRDDPIGSSPSDPSNPPPPDPPPVVALDPDPPPGGGGG